MTFRSLLLFVSIALCAFDVSAIGDSGGTGGPCSNQMFSGYRKALLLGSAQDIERESWHLVDAEIERQKKDRGGYFLAGERPDRNILFKRLSLSGLGYCITGSEALISAVVAGNVEVTRWLLAHGANPMAPIFQSDSINPSKNIFSFCQEQPLFIGNTYGINFEDEIVHGRRVQAYHYVILGGGKPDAPLALKIGNDNTNAMYTCSDLSLLDLFVNSGVELKQSYLKRAIDDALSWAPSTFWGQKRNGIDRVRFFISKGVRPDQSDLKRLSSPTCGKSNQGEFLEVCNRLRLIVGITDKEAKQ